jgi:hypothetical protein
VIITCSDPDITLSLFNLSFIVVLIDDVKLFNEPVDVSIDVNLLFCSKNRVVIPELNDAYPVVPLNITCDEPEINVGLFVISE